MATAPAAEVVSLLDGRAGLGDVVQAVAERRALGGSQTAALRRDALALCRNLLEVGALRLV